MESYLALYEVRPRWKVVCVHSFIPESTHIIACNAKRAENIILTHRGIQLLKKLDKFLQKQR